jgi:hypothetical protein
MKRKDAFHKLKTICQRLDELNPDEFKIQPLRLYLFGSVLTNKPDPKVSAQACHFDPPCGEKSPRPYF